MIAFASDCLLFELDSGESIPCSPDMVSVEIEGDAAGLFDSEFVEHVANAVFHYFKHELHRQSVSLGEFAGALEKLLRRFAFTTQQSAESKPSPRVLEADLHRLAGESGHGCELLFFARLRDELRQHLRQAPRLLRFHGLHRCVKQLTGARRWSPRCRTLEGEIVTYLRNCLSAEPAPSQFALLVD